MKNLLACLIVLAALTVGLPGHGHHKRHHAPIVQCTVPAPGEFAPANCLVVG